MILFKDFIRLREEQKEWARLNGLNEGDPKKNGEFHLIKELCNSADVFVDVGSNIGIFIDEWNFCAAKNSAFILAFEPNPDLQNILKTKIKNGKVFQVGLGDERGLVSFNLYKTDNTSSSLLDRSDMMPHFTKKNIKIKIQVDLLDNYFDLINENLNKALLVKIDVEGSESKVIKGGVKLFSILPNVFLMFEYSNAWDIGGYKLKEIFHILDRLDFNFFRITPLGIEEFRFYVPDMDQPSYCNYFAVKGQNPLQKNHLEIIPSVTHNLNKFYLFSGVE